MSFELVEAKKLNQSAIAHLLAKERN